MASKTEIRQSLLQNLKSPVWQKAKNSVVGQELISWGTEVIYALQQQRYAVEDVFNVTIANMQDIIRLSNSFIEPVQIADPSTVILPAALVDSIVSANFDSGFTKETFDTCQIIAKSGSVSFYNVSPLTIKSSGNKSLVLYQGIPKVKYYCASSIQDSARLNYISTFPGRIYDEVPLNSTWVENNIYSNYLNIGPDVLVDSIRVWYVQNGLKLMHLQNALEASPDDLSYKIYIAQNGDYNIVFGNGVSGHFVSESDQVYVEFLQVTNTEFDSNLKLQFKGDSTVTINHSDWDQSTAVMYRAQDLESSERAIADLRKKIALHQTLSTTKQIELYLQTRPEISDVIVRTDTTISPLTVVANVLVSDPAITDGSYIREDLETRVPMVYDVRVVLPEVYTFTVGYTLTSDQEPFRGQIESVISNLFNSSDFRVFNTPFKDSDLIARVKEVVGITIQDVLFTVTHGGSTWGTDTLTNTESNNYFLQS